MVLAVSTEVVVPGGVTESGFRLDAPQVRGLAAPGGTVVTAQVRFTVLLNPPDGVTVMVEVLPVLTPALTTIAPLLVSAKSWGRLTVTFTTVVEVSAPEVPVTVMAYDPGVVVAVVTALSTEVSAPAPVMLTESGLRSAVVQVSGFAAPAGAVVTAQVRFTTPVKLSEGVTVMVEVLPVVAPWTTVIFPLFESAKVGVETSPLTSAVMARVWMNSPVAASLPVTRTL